MSGCWNLQGRRGHQRRESVRQGRSRRLKHSCIGTSATRTKAIDMTDDPGEGKGTSYPAMQQHLGRHLKSSPCPLFFPPPHPCSRWRHSWADGVSTRMLLFRHPVRRLPDADVIGFRFGISYADAFGHRGFSHSLAFALLMGCAGFGVAPLFLHGSRLMGLTVGLLAVSAISCWTQ